MKRNALVESIAPLIRFKVSQDSCSPKTSPQPTAPPTQTAHALHS